MRSVLIRIRLLVLASRTVLAEVQRAFSRVQFMKSLKSI
jgi:hypothetical protein